MTITPGPARAKESLGVPVAHSDAVGRLVSTRAQIVAMMRDPQLPPLAKQVGALLWAITETWERGEAKTITYHQLAEQIVWQSRDGGIQTASAEGVRKAVKALREAGYVVVASAQHPGNVKPASMHCIPRGTDDVLTSDEKGPFRVWPKDLLPGTAGSQEPGVPAHDAELPVPGNRDLESGGTQEPGVTEVPVPRNRPKKETSHKTTFLSEEDLLAPPPPCGEAAETFLAAVTWDDLGSPSEVVDLLAHALNADGQKEVRKRNKRSEIERGVRTLLDDGWDTPRIVAGVGLWAGDRQLRNSDVLDEIAKRLVRTELSAPARLALRSPIDVLRQTFALGEEVRREREENYTAS